LGGFEIMLTYEKCKKALNKNGNIYTNEEIHIIRNVLNKLAEIELRHIKKEKEVLK